MGNLQKNLKDRKIYNQSTRLVSSLKVEDYIILTLMRRNDASINLKTGLKQIKQTSLKTFFFKKLSNKNDKFHF